MHPQTERGIQILTKLGLTQYQARVLLALEQSGVTNANSVSIISRVPREKVYGVLQSLMEMGLVNKVLTSPTTYKALRLDQAVALLTDMRQRSLEELNTEISVLIKDYKANEPEEANTEEPSMFEQILGKDAILQDMIEAFKNAEDSIDAVLSWKNYLELSQFTDVLKKANRRGVKIQLVIRLPQDPQHAQEVLQTKDLSFCKYVVSNAPSTFLQICDKKKVLIFTQTKGNLKEASAIVTNNSSFIEIANSYFLSVWQNVNQKKPKLSVKQQHPVR